MNGKLSKYILDRTFLRVGILAIASPLLVVAAPLVILAGYNQIALLISILAVFAAIVFLPFPKGADVEKISKIPRSIKLVFQVIGFLFTLITIAFFYDHGFRHLFSFVHYGHDDKLGSIDEGQ